MENVKDKDDMKGSRDFYQIYWDIGRCLKCKRAGIKRCARRIYVIG